MKHIHSIAVATDFSAGSNAALERAVQLAVAHGASLRLLHAFDVSAGHSLQGIFDPQRLSTTAPPDVLMRQHLSELAASLVMQTGLRVETGFSLGKADSAIGSYVSAHEVALLVMGSRAEPAMAGLGSTASKLLRSLACPILIVRSGGERPYEKVLVAVDLREGSARVAAAALRVFPAARHHLLHAAEPALERDLATSAGARDQPRESARALAVRQLGQLASELMNRFDHQVVAEVVDDVPLRAVVEHAASLHADCVVFGYHGRGAERQLGGAVLHVLHHTLRDVLMVP